MKKSGSNGLNLPDPRLSAAALLRCSNTDINGRAHGRTNLDLNRDRVAGRYLRNVDIQLVYTRELRTQARELHLSRCVADRHNRGGDCGAKLERSWIVHRRAAVRLCRSHGAQAGSEHGEQVAGLGK